MNQAGFCDEHLANQAGVCGEHSHDGSVGEPSLEQMEIALATLHFSFARRMPKGSLLVASCIRARERN